VDNFRLRTIQYSVDEDFFKPSEAKKTEGRRRLGIPNNNIVVNATCRLSQEKGIEYLLPAFKQAIAQNNRIICLLVGTGNMAAFAAEFVKQNGLENRIILIGEASPEKVRDLLQLSDVFVYAGVSGSNVSLAVLEAMAVRLAVIAADSPISHRDLLANNRGIAVSTKNTPALAKAINLLSENDSMRKKMAENGRRWVLEHHSLKAVKANMEALVRT
jgi:glycosyltransferase involved in cell wall biosynthesis